MLEILRRAFEHGLTLSQLYLDHGGVWIAQFERRGVRLDSATGKDRISALENALFLARSELRAAE